MTSECPGYRRVAPQVSLMRCHFEAMSILRISPEVPPPVAVFSPRHRAKDGVGTTIPKHAAELILTVIEQNISMSRQNRNTNPGYQHTDAVCAYDFVNVLRADVSRLRTIGNTTSDMEVKVDQTPPQPQRYVLIL